MLSTIFVYKWHRLTYNVSPKYVRKEFWYPFNMMPTTLPFIQYDAYQILTHEIAYHEKFIYTV